MKSLLFFVGLLFLVTVHAQRFTQQQYKEDFSAFWQTFQDNYCYFDKRHVDWAGLKPFYQTQVDTVTMRSGFVSVLERALNELYDHHCSLHTNNPTSIRLV